jgi:TldD protein
MDAKIPEQIQAMPDRLVALATLNKRGRPASIGRYTLVCDGATMAALVEATLGIGTQLDRILGYEANAGGTSFISDPLAVLGTLQVASPLVNVTANRSAPGQLATVKWDNEGTEPHDFRLVKNGILDDFQTTREQAMWLAPSYRGIGRLVRSNGCAASENALAITMQHMPNLSLEPATSNTGLNDLVAGVQSGVLLEGGTITQMDAQARNGLLGHNLGALFRKITNGRVGPVLNDATVQINTLQLWKNVTAVGGPSTRMMLPPPRYASMPVKGQPPQRTSHSVVAAAAVIEKQPIIDIRRKA